MPTPSPDFEDNCIPQLLCRAIAQASKQRAVKQAALDTVPSKKRFYNMSQTAPVGVLEGNANKTDSNRKEPGRDFTLPPGLQNTGAKSC